MFREYNLSVNPSSTITSMKESGTSREISPFGCWLLSEIRRAGMNQTEFAGAVKTSGTTVSRWIHGRMPNGRYIERIADVLVLDYDLVATKAGYRPRELLEIDPESATARLMPLIEQIDWETRPGRLEGLEFELRQMIEWDRMRKEAQ